MFICAHQRRCVITSLAIARSFDTGCRQAHLHRGIDRVNTLYLLPTQDFTGQDVLFSREYTQNVRNKTLIMLVKKIETVR